MRYDIKEMIQTTQHTIKIKIMYDSNGARRNRGLPALTPVGMFVQVEASAILQMQC